MRASDIPGKFYVPWGAFAGGSYIRPIPLNSQIGIQDGAASLHDGFVPLNFTPLGAGGVPPFGQDANGILNQVTAWNQWQQAGGAVPYDSGFSTAIGGYPIGAIIPSATNFGLTWLSLVNNNTDDPDLGTSVNWGGFYPFAPQSADTGTANHIVAPIPFVVSTIALLTGVVIQVKKNNAANTGGVNMQVNGSSGHLTAPLLRSDGASLQANDLLANEWFWANCDGTNFYVIGSVASQVAAACPVASASWGWNGSAVYFLSNANIASIVRTATGKYTVTLTSNILFANGGAAHAAGRTAGGAHPGQNTGTPSVVIAAGNPVTFELDVQNNNDGNLVDPDFSTLIVLGS